MLFALPLPREVPWVFLTAGDKLAGRAELLAHGIFAWGAVMEVIPHNPDGEYSMAPDELRYVWRDPLDGLLRQATTARPERQTPRETYRPLALLIHPETRATTLIETLGVDQAASEQAWRDR